MKLWLSIFAASLIARSAAQTPNGFNVTVSAPLEVVVQPSNINLTPSLLVSQAESLDTPWIYLPSNASSDRIYLLIMIDSGLPLLQWMQPNLVPDTGNNLTFDAVVEGASAAVGAPYVYPQPPVGVLHQYTYLLYEQPPNWAFPTNYSSFNPPADIYARFPFEIADFQSSAGLNNPIAANYMRVLNSTAEASSSLISATQTALTLSAEMTLTSASSSTATTEIGSSTLASASATSATTTSTSNAAGSLAQLAQGVTRWLLYLSVLAL